MFYYRKGYQKGFIIGKGSCNNAIPGAINFWQWLYPSGSLKSLKHVEMLIE